MALPATARRTRCLTPLPREVAAEEDDTTIVTMIGEEDRHRAMVTIGEEGGTTIDEEVVEGTTMIGAVEVVEDITMIERGEGLEAEAQRETETGEEVVTRSSYM